MSKMHATVEFFCLCSQQNSRYDYKTLTLKQSQHIQRDQLHYKIKSYLDQLKGVQEI